TPIKGNENSQEVKNQSDFQMGEVTPLPVKITDEPNKICSPLTSVPLEELPTVVSDPYRPPLPGKDDRHQGVDFAFYRRYGLASIAGEIVQAVFEGKVAGIVENKYPYGNALIIETPFDKISQTSRQTLGLQKDQSIYTLYGHLDHISIKEIAQEIEACQALGLVGKTGNAGVEHLHLEMRIGFAGEILPSMSYYVKGATPAEREAYLRWRISNEFVHFNPMLLLDTTP
ncbi:MAG: M23 family metallopeptidase, partial [Anaerolineaceae bacterium]